MSLDKMQKNALRLFKAGYNLFITGSAGTGKSHLIKSIISKYNELNGTIDNLVITSTTGISALNINGITIHSWSNIKPDTDLSNIDLFVQKVKRNHKTLNKYLYTKVLIIDEVSMLTHYLLDFINVITKKLRQSDDVFGGIQVILLGDFFQLPPINKYTSDTMFCFNAECWDTLIDYTIILKTIHRQTNTELITFLNKIRIGKCDNYVKKSLEKYANNPNYINTNNYTHLYPNKLNVNVHNLKNLYKLKGDLLINNAKIISMISSSHSFPNDTIIVEELQLKKGAFVIINKNIDAEKFLVNGTQCIFNGFTESGKAIITTNNGKTHYLSKQKWEYPNFYIEQYPLCLAWALTIHKSQGMGIEYLSVDIGKNIFTDGQTYVALSRSSNADNLHIKNYSYDVIRANPAVKKFYIDLISKSNKWKLLEDSNYYQNIISGYIRKSIPNNGIIIDDNKSPLDSTEKKTHIDNNTKSITSITSITSIVLDQLCKKCTENVFDFEYSTWYNERVCLQCIMDDTYYRQVNKTEMRKLFNLNEKHSKKILDKCKYRPQRNLVNVRFKPTKLYLVGHIKRELNNTLYMYTTKVPSSNKQRILRVVKKSNLKKTTNEKMASIFNDYFINKKTIKLIANEMQYSKITIENYLYRCYISDNYIFIPDYLSKLGINNDLADKVKNIVYNWRIENSEPETFPRLKYIRSKLPNKISYLVIKILLFKVFRYKT